MFTYYQFQNLRGSLYRLKRRIYTNNIDLCSLCFIETEKYFRFFSFFVTTINYTNLHGCCTKKERNCFENDAIKIQCNINPKANPLVKDNTRLVTYLSATRMSTTSCGTQRRNLMGISQLKRYIHSISCLAQYLLKRIRRTWLFFNST